MEFQNKKMGKNIAGNKLGRDFKLVGEESRKFLRQI
jgi:hypothetical protein